MVGLVDLEQLAGEGDVGVQVGQHAGQAAVGELLHPVGQVGGAEGAHLLPHRLHGGPPVPRQLVGHRRQVGGRVLVQRRQDGRERSALADLVELGPHQRRRAGHDLLELGLQRPHGWAGGGNRNAGR